MCGINAYIYTEVKGEEMAARKTKNQTERTKDLIRSGQLLKVLMNHALSDSGDTMTASQVQAAKILLAKTNPDLKAVEVKAETDNTVRITWGDDK